VSTRGPSLTAHIEAVTPDTVDVLAKGDEIASGVRAIAQDQLGLKMQDKPHVIIKPRKVNTTASGGRALFGAKKRAGADEAAGSGGK
jgi:transcriptional regulator of nitric oxide reductase